MSTVPKITLILPCYNEGQHLEKSLAKIESFMSFSFAQGEYEIILVDDFSRDETRQLLQKFSSAPYHVHFNAKNLGRGATVREGFKLAKGKIIGFMDIDCEVAEYYITEFVRRIEQGADLAIAQRIYRVAPHPYVVLRHLLSIIYKFFLKKMVGCPAHDTEAGFKFFSRPMAEALLAKSQFDSWFWDTECVLLGYLWSYKVSEVPVAFLRNPEKKSTVKVFRDSWQYLLDLKRFWYLKRGNMYGQ